MIPNIERIDTDRMVRERRERLLQSMAHHDIDALLICSRANVIYATGAMSVLSDASYEFLVPSIALLTRDGAAPHLFSACKEGIPASIPASHIHPPLYPEIEEGVHRMVDRLKSVAGSALKGKVAVDDYTPAMFSLLPELLPEATFVDPTAALSEARIVKTRDEIECLRVAEAINDTAMYDVLPHVRPGVRATDLTGIFLQRIRELGATGNHIDPIWMPVPRYLADGPLMLLDDLAFPLPTTDRILREGDVLMIDTGVEYLGYASDFGRTWIASLAPERHTHKLQDQYRLWRDVSLAVREVCRPGKTGADVTQAALRAAGQRKCWLKQFYLIHGIGLDSAEMPLIGTSLGHGFDESVVLKPGMVLVIEPCIFDEGVGGYRSEDIVVVTETEPMLISDFPYTPWED